MKFNSTWHNDGRYHQYCLACNAETVSQEQKLDRTYYRCATCGSLEERSIVIDPKINWWVDEAGEYWHESAGVFVQNQEGKFLFFERTIFPFAFTIPAGHVDVSEEPSVSAVRELQEEVGIRAENLSHVGDDDIVGDSCRRGADAHRWHSYVLRLNTTPKVEIQEEGTSAQWLSLEEALAKNLTFPVSHVIKKYKDELKSGTV